MSEVGDLKVAGEDEIHEEESEPKDNGVQDSEDFPHEEGYTDIALLVENKRIHLNKGFLMSTSPVFKAMLLDNFKEKNAKEIPLPDKKYDEVAVFMKCLLQNEETKLSDRVVIPVMYLALEYQTMQLVYRCEEFLIQRTANTSISTQYLLEIYQVAEISMRASLVETTLRHLVKRAYIEMRSKEIYKKLPLELRVNVLEKRLYEMESFCKKIYWNVPGCEELFQNNSLWSAK